MSTNYFASRYPHLRKGTRHDKAREVVVVDIVDIYSSDISRYSSSSSSRSGSGSSIISRSSSHVATGSSNRIAARANNPAVAMVVIASPALAVLGVLRGGGRGLKETPLSQVGEKT